MDLGTIARELLDSEVLLLDQHRSCQWELQLELLAIKPQGISSKDKLYEDNNVQVSGVALYE